MEGCENQKQLSLYYWGEVEALKQYTRGTAFAIAESVEQARDLIIDEYAGEYTIITSLYIREKIDRLLKELKDTEPCIYTEPKGFYEQGSA